MRIATLYDVHGNIRALEAVLAGDPGRRDDRRRRGRRRRRTASAGDARAPALRSAIVSRWLRGNADRELMPGEPGLAPPELIDAVRAELTDEQIAFLLRAAADRADRQQCSTATRRRGTTSTSSPNARQRSVSRRSSQTSTPMSIVCGHTHMQFDRTIAGKRVINSGSVGMPYEDLPRRVLDARPRASAHGVRAPTSRSSCRRSREEIDRVVRIPCRLTSFRSAASGARTDSTGRSSSKARAIAPTRSRPGRRVYVDGEPVKIVASKHGSQKRPVIRLERRVERGATLAVPRESLPALDDGRVLRLPARRARGRRGGRTPPRTGP